MWTSPPSTEHRQRVARWGGGKRYRGNLCHDFVLSTRDLGNYRRRQAGIIAKYKGLAGMDDGDVRLGYPGGRRASLS